ncbi:MAG: methyltransferase domain-containing protein, partial [Myxococcota bacterium]
GCGKGRHSALCATWGAKDVLAIDLGSAVDACYRNCRRFTNVHVIQADLFHLPVRPRSVDVAFSVGVLHHTPNPGHCFQELVKTVCPGGRVIAWVYGRENNGWIIYGVNPLRTAITSRLPHRWVRELAKVPAAMILGVGRAVYQPLNRPPFESVGDKLFYAPYITHISKFPYSEIHSIVHDHLTPPIAHYIPREEFQSWFDALRLEDIQIGWHNQNSWRGTAVVPAPFGEPKA